MADDGRRGQKPATIYDVAARAGVSHQTVSRLLLGHEGIRPSTRDKVLVAIAELDYRTNVVARNLRNGRTGLISLAIPSLDQPDLAELAQHVMTAARLRSLTVLIETTEGDAARERELISGSRGSIVDGIILVPRGIGSQDLSAIALSSPLVILGKRVAQSPFDHVAMPNAAGGRAAVDHLLAIGSKRIAALGPASACDYDNAPQRMQGYRQALEAAGIPLDERLMVTAGNGTRLDGLSAINELLASGVAFDSVFCVNDALALGAMRGLFEAGLLVGHDVAVIGFGDTQDAHFATPGLTSISAGSEQIASAAVDQLDWRLKNRDAAREPQDFLSEFSLVVRESTTGTQGTTRDQPATPSQPA